MPKIREQANTTLLLALACGASQEAAARQANISHQTVWRRLQDPEFRNRLKDLRSEMVMRVSGMLTAASLDSVKTLLDLHTQRMLHFNSGRCWSLLNWRN
jgi:hypothetical protein